MKIVINPAVIIATALSFVSCKSADVKPTFCDTACIRDSLKFSGEHPLKPYVYLSVKDCKPDTLTWSYYGMGTNRKTGFEYLLGTQVNMNKDFIRCYIRDTAYAWLLFNDCVTGRGFQIKLPYAKNASFALKSSGINNFDKKFSIEESLIVNTDRGNIYVEDMKTGKKAMMTFGEKLDIDYDAMHEYIDSVNVTSSRIWVKVKIGTAWQIITKDITLE